MLLLRLLELYTMVRMIFKFIFFSVISHLQKQSQALSYKSSCAGKYEYFYNVGEFLNISF